MYILIGLIALVIVIAVVIQVLGRDNSTYDETPVPIETPVEEEVPVAPAKPKRRKPTTSDILPPTQEL